MYVSTFVRCCDGEWLLRNSDPTSTIYRMERYNSISCFLICYIGVRSVVFPSLEGTKWSLCVHSRRILNAYCACTSYLVHRIPDLLGLWGLVGFWCVALLALCILYYGKICFPGSSRVLLRTQRAFFVVRKQSLLPKVHIFETQKMALLVAKSKF